MAFKLRVPNKTAIITHPKDPDLRVEVSKPDIADIIEFQEMMKQFVKKEPLVHPVTHELVFKLGKPVMYEVQLPIPFNKGIELIAKHIKDVQGIEDMKFTPSIANEVLRRFLDPEFNFKQEQDVPLLDDAGEQTGETKREEVDVNFCTFLANKVMSEETYARPLESPTQSTSTATGG